ncbi:putative intracellular protease/amidase [Variovorax boronicumulans]|nr:putative intracellular protease/amidase [Variovorax boronicumulans]
MPRSRGTDQRDAEQRCLPGHGKNVSAFTDDEERAVSLDKIVPFLLASTLTQRGAHHHPAPDWNAKVVVDGRLVTGRNPQSAAGVGAAMRELLLHRN